MKKFAATMLLLLLMTVPFAGSVGAVIHNPDRHAVSKDKDYDPNACTCLFHAIEHFVKDLFTGAD